MTPIGGLKTFRARHSLTENRVGGLRHWLIYSGILWPSLYSNWDSEELHDNVTVPACMVMHSYGHWSDFSCELGRFAFICERRQNC